MINPQWMIPCFPRFYKYDVLRGLRFLTHWSERCHERIAWDAISEVVTSLDQWFGGTGHEPEPRRETRRGQWTLVPTEHAWKRTESAETFPLLEAVVERGVATCILHEEWVDVLTRLAAPGAVV